MVRTLFRLALVLCLAGGAEAGGYGTPIPPPQGQSYPDPAYKKLGDCIEQIIAEPALGVDPCVPAGLAVLLRNLLSTGKICIAPQDDPASDSDMLGAARHGDSEGRVSGADAEAASRSSALTLGNGSIVFNGDSWKALCATGSKWTDGRKDIQKKFLIVEEGYHSVQVFRQYFAVIFGLRSADPAAAGIASALDSGRSHYYEIESTAFTVGEILKQVGSESAKQNPDQQKIKDLLGETMSKMNDELGANGPFAQLCYWLTNAILTGALPTTPAVAEAFVDWQRCKDKFDTAFNSLNAALQSRGFNELTR